MMPNSDGNSVDDSVALMDGRNGGRLRRGNPGNRGGPGVVPNHIRTHCRGSFAERVPILEAIADGKPLDMTRVIDGVSETIQISASIKERISAIETLGKYGGVADLPLEGEETPDGRLPTRQDAERVWDALRRIESIEALEKALVERARKQLGSGE